MFITTTNIHNTQFTSEKQIHCRQHQIIQRKINRNEKETEKESERKRHRDGMKEGEKVIEMTGHYIQWPFIAMLCIVVH